MKRVLGERVRLRDVEVADSRFILDLRASRGEYLSTVDPEISKQVDWIESYKVRRKTGLEYYFIIEDENLTPIGTVRIYNIDKARSSFSFGSFIVASEKKANKYSALDAMTLVFDFAFNKLLLKECFFDCRKLNTRANNFYVRYGAICLKEDDLDIFYTYDADIFNSSVKNN
jgi:RimJ/RimL family protein N-acetyltransferase